MTTNYRVTIDHPALQRLLITQLQLTTLLSNDLPATYKVRSNDLPLKVQVFEFPKYLGHNVLGPTLRTNTKVPLRALECTWCFGNSWATSTSVHNGLYGTIYKYNSTGPLYGHNIIINNVSLFSLVLRLSEIPSLQRIHPSYQSWTSGDSLLRKYYQSAKPLLLPWKQFGYQGLVDMQ